MSMNVGDQVVVNVPSSVFHNYVGTIDAVAYDWKYDWVVQLDYKDIRASFRESELVPYIDDSSKDPLFENHPLRGM